MDAFGFQVPSCDRGSCLVSGGERCIGACAQPGPLLSPPLYFVHHLRDSLRSRLMNGGIHQAVITPSREEPNNSCLMTFSDRFVSLRARVWLLVQREGSRVPATEETCQPARAIKDLFTPPSHRSSP